MKKEKIISSVLAGSMILSLGGCSVFGGDKKAVLEAADEYAQALLDGDVDDIIDLMKDGDDYEDELTEFFDKNKNNAALGDVFEAIEDTMTYEINKGSVGVSKKDKKADLLIDYTMVDYEEIFDRVVDEEGNIDDYVDAIEENEDNLTITVELHVSFVLSHDEWLVKDKNNENVYDLYEFYENISGFSFFNIPAVSMDDFEDCIENIYDAEYDWDYYRYDYSDYSYVGYWNDSNDIYMYVYDDADDARENFDFYTEAFQGTIADGEFDGDYTLADSGNEGYIIFNGECDSWDFYDGDIYGCIFLKDNTIMSVMTHDASQSRNDKIEDFLEELDLPSPSSSL